MNRPFLRMAAAMAATVLVAGCANDVPKHLRPLSYQTQVEMKLKSLELDAPILVRIFKEESVLEVWKRGPSGKYAMLKSFPICKWSGKLGPKQKQGDRQAPEGYYTIRPAQMNPLSSYYLSFNLGYPNAYDRAYGRTGKHLMVHGACSSAGCYSMTDDYIADIYALAREAFDGGQPEFQVQAYPFRMTDEKMVSHAGHKWFDFWQNLKEGYDYFEATNQPPKVNVCGKRYVFNADFAVPESRISASEPCPPYVALSDVSAAENTGGAAVNPVLGTMVR